MSDSIKTICMPKWGLSMKEGTVAAWLVDEGDEISPGDEIMDVETEKISSAVEASENGILKQQVANEGETLPVGALLGVIGNADTSEEDINSFITEFQANYVPPADDEEDASAATENIELKGRNIRYLKKGEGGSPLILVHGFGGDLNNWLFNHDALAGQHTAYALDLPGHGSSSKDVGEGTVTNMAEIIIAFMDALELDKAHLIGHSLGGAIVLSIALACPEKVESLTLIGSAGLGEEIDGEYLNGFITAERRKDLKPHVEKLFSDPALVTRQLINDLLAFKRIDGVQPALEKILASFAPNGKQSNILRDKIKTVSCPVLVIWGANDRIIPASHSKDLGDNVRVKIIEGQGHMVQMEAATEINQLIEEATA